MRQQAYDSPPWEDRRGAVLSAQRIWEMPEPSSLQRTPQTNQNGLGGIIPSGRWAARCGPGNDTARQHCGMVLRLSTAALLPRMEQVPTPDFRPDLPDWNLATGGFTKPHFRQWSTPFEHQPAQLWEPPQHPTHPAP